MVAIQQTHAAEGSTASFSRLTRGSIVLRVLMLGAWWLVSQTAHGEPNRYQCSYYLFEVPATVNGCSDCYIPLVVTQGPIEARWDQEVVVITTYERDSIWQVQRQVLKAADLAIEGPARRIKLGGKIYRYQLVGNTEAVRLLKNSLGTIPVHRISHPRKDDDGLWDVLLHDLSMSGGAESCAAGDAR